ncbi:uncharacterized protein LOC124143780 isoform X2 [Haliotis rufescens]|uniref:uncharacterized protein LOC124143780 isoform X2 n=1 Tax=Haliotis rufescens TaxID=6454 RepID=UPI00201EB61A|nr:uncharacterized protein LOC124143780 isoform X2 [Haliotis rufescens]
MDRAMHRTVHHGYLESDSVVPMCSNGLQDPTSSLRTLIEDIKKLDDDRVHYFAKLATVIPRLQDCTHCDGIDIPESPQFWSQVLDLLVKQKEWLAVDFLVQPRTGHRASLDGRAATLPTTDICIASILGSVNDVDLSVWGIRLAITLLEKGTPIESIVDEDGEPLMIAAVRSATRSGNLDLMKYVLERQPDLILQIDQPDSQGDTPLHLCVKSPSLSVTHRQDLLQLLLGLGCCTSVQDSRGMTAVQYLDTEDPGHQLLEHASRYAGEGLRIRMDSLKVLGDGCFEKDEYREALKWYREAMTLAESVSNLKLDLALLYSACSTVYINLAIIEDEDDETSPSSFRGMEELHRQKTQLLSLLSGHNTTSGTPVLPVYEDDLSQGQGDGPSNTTSDTQVQLEYEDDLSQRQGDGPTNTTSDTPVQLEYEDDLSQRQGDEPTNTSSDTPVQPVYNNDLSQRQGDGPTNTSSDTPLQLKLGDDLSQRQGDGPTNTSSDTPSQLKLGDDLSQRQGDGPTNTFHDPPVQLEYEDDLSQRQGDEPTNTSSDAPSQFKLGDDLSHRQGDGPTNTSSDTPSQLKLGDDLSQRQGDGPTNTSSDPPVQLEYEDDLSQRQGDEPTNTSSDAPSQFKLGDDLSQRQGDGPTNTFHDPPVRLEYEDDLSQRQGDEPTNTSSDAPSQFKLGDDLSHRQGDGPTNTSSDTPSQLKLGDDLSQRQGDGPTNTSSDPPVQLEYEDDLSQRQGDEPTNTSSDTPVQLELGDDLSQRQGDEPTNTSSDPPVQLEHEDDLSQRQGDEPTNTSSDPLVLPVYEDDLSQRQGNEPTNTSSDTPVQLEYEDVLSQRQGNEPTNTSSDPPVQLEHEDDLSQRQGDEPTNTSSDPPVQLEYEDVLSQRQGNEPTNTSSDTPVQLEHEDDLSQRQGDEPTNTTSATPSQLKLGDDLSQRQGDGPTNTFHDPPLQLEYEDDLSQRQGDEPTNTSSDTPSQLKLGDDLSQRQGDGPTNTSSDTPVQLEHEDDLSQRQGDKPTNTTSATPSQLEYEDDLSQRQGDGPTNTFRDTPVQLEHEDDLSQRQGDEPTNTSSDPPVLPVYEDDLSQRQGDEPTNTSSDTPSQLKLGDDLSQRQGDGPTNTFHDTAVQLEYEGASCSNVIPMTEGTEKVHKRNMFSEDLDDRASHTDVGSEDTEIREADERKGIIYGEDEGVSCSKVMQETKEVYKSTVNEEVASTSTGAVPDTAESKRRKRQGQVCKDRDEEGNNAEVILKPSREAMNQSEKYSDMPSEGGCSTDVSQLDIDGTNDKWSQPDVSDGKPKTNQMAKIPSKTEYAQSHHTNENTENKKQAPRISKLEHSHQRPPRIAGVSMEDDDSYEIYPHQCSHNTAPGGLSELVPRQLADCTEMETRASLSIGETPNEAIDDTNGCSSSSESYTLTGSDASNVTVIERNLNASTSSVKVEKWLQSCDKSQPKSMRDGAKMDEKRHSSDPLLDDGSSCSDDHSDANMTQVSKQAVHMDLPDHRDDITCGETSNGKIHGVCSVSVSASEKSTTTDTVKVETKTDVVSNEVFENSQTNTTVLKESNATAKIQERIDEETCVPSQKPTSKSKTKSQKKKKKKKEQKKMMVKEEQSPKATHENDSQGENIKNEIVDKENSEKPKEQKPKIVKSIPERPVLKVSECKSDILEMIQNSTSSIMRSISEAPGSEGYENAASIKKEAETAEEEGEKDDFGTLNDEEDVEFKPAIFDNLPWEVEFTADAWKRLSGKTVQLRLKQRAVRIITELASGNWKPDICKPVSTSTGNIFVSELSQTTSLIWEKAVAFSGLCSDLPSKRMQDEDDTNFAVKGGRIYTQIIRVWDIVSSDDDIQRLSESIRTSYKRGQTSLLKRNLKGLERSHHTEKHKQLPLHFAEQDMTVKATNPYMFFPPASPDPREYHILKFYTFTAALVNIILSKMHRKADLPFKVTDKEHAIIHLSGEAPILLLGRSGTGKTTCCLYRLWTNFISYWRLAQETGDPFLPRLDWVFAGSVSADEDENENPEDDEQADTPEAAEVQPSFERQDEEEDLDLGEYDHLHQIFVTKNPVLCTEVHKNFYELCHACDETADHVETEGQEIPSRLQDIEDLSYPLFLTSKQLLMMLDGSLGQPYFFERNEDGSLGVTVQGWEEEGDVLGFSLMDQDSDDEDFMGMNIDYDIDEDVLQQGAAAGIRQRKVDPRKEVTYEVFTSTIWPKIQKKAKYHPSLIWTEIMSFIKGSFEALTKADGHLSEQEYIEVGRKKAPNFSGERETIYQLFKRYDHYKKQHLLFDEADLVLDIFKRLRILEELPWVVHQLYVDETQDFTQSELSVLLRITQNPNDMFLTGDTAQGIMRGISFRFCDLKSLFFHAKQSLVAGNLMLLNEPKQVYQLTHSYRSHAGILALASAVLDLMVEFFPESFDKLKKDQGLLDGPLPLLMESCRPQDLAILLQGNNRKASHIEFGAHQAILVVNDAAKEKMPDMLSRHSIVLTVYESKGLEFDDILLYNFFTDSQATKEWRVVTTFLETLASRPQHEEQAENLHIIDEEMLRQPNRPRALAFEANEHKVLNSELKYLYTALTRARVNVWIFDEDEEKRAPMFEYFKARKLVRCISQTEDGNSEFTNMVFAMKSSPEDWVRRGDEMMSQTLYEVAVNCYRMGGDENKEQLAVAHCQAQGALKLKDTPRKMREEFVFAAHKFLHCGEVMKAATCLQNAREFELAAKLFQKMKRHLEAARLFQKSGKHTEASDCYEQLGLYNRAIELLDREELYELAIDCLRRYQVKVQERRGTDRGMMKVLENNKPGAQFTLDNLYFKLVKFNHKHKNKPKMLAALDHLPHDDQLEFLEKNKYLKEAAQLMLKGGKSSHSEVAQMLLRHGATRDALQHAEQGTDVDVRGKCHHSLALELYSEIKEKCQSEDFNVDSSQREIISHFQKAASAFEETENNNSAGMASFFIALIQKRIINAKKAFALFRKVSPFANEAGMVEALKIFVHSVSNGQLSDCQLLVTGAETLLSIITTLLKPDSREKSSRCTLYLQFYGLHQDDKDPNQLMAYPKQRPLCADVLPGLFSKKEKRTVHLDKQDMSLKISLYLVGILKEWMKICRNWIENDVSRNKQCRSFQEGRCAGNKSCDTTKCHHLHEPFIRATALRGLRALLLRVRLEHVIQCGVKSVQDIALKEQTRKKTLDNELGTLTDDTATRAAFGRLMHFVFPESHHFRNLTENKEVMRIFKDTLDSANLKKVIHQIVNQWSQNTLQVKCKSSDWFVRAIILVSLFKIQDIDLKKMSFNMMKQLRDSHLLDEEARYAFFSFGRNNVIIHLGGQFYKAFDALKEDPVSSVFEYSTFVKILGHRNKPSLFPEMPLFLFWHEFFMTVALTSFAKLSETGRFVLPATYLATLPFVNGMLPQGSRSIQGSINSVSRDQRSIKLFQVHLQSLAGVLCGNRTEMNLLSYIFRPREDFDYLQAERCLILGLVVLANIGLLQAPSVEVSLMEAIMRLELPENAPARLTKGLGSIKESKGIADLVDILQRMLKEREDEYLHLCRWKWDPYRNEGIQRQQLTSFDLFPSTFISYLQPMSPAVHDERKHNAAGVLQRFFRNLTLIGRVEMGNLKQRCQQQMLKDQHDHSEDQVPDESSARNEEEITMSAEEAERQKEEFDKFLQDEQEDKSAWVLQRFFRRLTFTGRVEGGHVRERCQEQELKEIFSFYDITEQQCGVCWESFKTEETEIGKPSIESDPIQSETNFETIEKEEITQLTVSESLMDQQKTSQKLREEHLSSVIHKGNMRNFQFFKDLYREYFVSKVLDIQTFIEQLRNQKICMDMAAVHLVRFDYMMSVVQMLYQGIFHEYKWDLVYDLRSKLIPLCFYYNKVSEELETMKKQAVIQQEQQPQLISGDGSSNQEMTKETLEVVDHVEDKLLEVAYEEVKPIGPPRQNRDDIDQGHGHSRELGNDQRGAGYVGRGVPQHYGRGNGGYRHDHGEHRRDQYHEGRNDYNQGQDAHRGGRGGNWRGGWGNRGPNEFYGRGYNQRGAGGYGRGYRRGHGRPGGGPAGQARGRGHQFPNAPPRHQRQQQFQQYQQNRFQFQ